MSTEIDETVVARSQFGNIVRNGRAVMGIKRPTFALMVDLQKDFMAAVEHGNPPAVRRTLRHMIEKLGLSQKEKNKAYGFIDRICLQRLQKRKFHLRIGVLNRRRRVIR